MKFKPSKDHPDVWMRPEPGGTCYEYIAVYVDDLAIAAKDPQAFCHELKKKNNLKLKGVGPLGYHLGCTYKKEPDGTLAADPRRYVNKILESYERMLKEKPRKSRPPLEGGDHPELDTSEHCDERQTKQFQTLIGQLQWLISLGRFDIAVHVMSLSRFRAQPRKGHLDRANHEVIAQNFRKPHALEDNLKFITQGKTSYIQSNVMISLSLMISYIKHRQYSAKSKYFGPFYYIQIDPQDYDEWRTSPPEEEIHFQTPSKIGSATTPRSTVSSEASESYITLTNFK